MRRDDQVRDSPGNIDALLVAGNLAGHIGAFHDEAQFAGQLARLAGAGLSVKFGMKEGGDATKALAGAGKNASAAPTKEAAAWAEVVFLAVPAQVAVDVAASLAGELAGRVVVDCNNPLTWKDGPVWAPPAEGSRGGGTARRARRPP